MFFRFSDSSNDVIGKSQLALTHTTIKRFQK